MRAVVKFMFCLGLALPLTESACWWWRELYGEWSSWSSCDVPCGGGHRVRSHYICAVNELGFKTERSRCAESCLNNGIFINTSCKCQAGFKGRCCEVAPLCNPKCQNNGMCIADDLCKCENGFYGIRCEKGADFDKNLIPQLHTSRPIDELNTPLAWFDVPTYDSRNKACFIKVQVQNAYADTILVADSRFPNGTTESFGNFSAAPIDSSASFNGTSRFACLQVRCPGMTADGNDFDVVVDVTVESTYTKCHLENATKKMNVYVSSDPYGNDKFTVNLENGDNYGPVYGVYVNTGYREKAMYLAQQGCYSGKYYNYNNFSPSSGILAKYNCI